MRPISRAIAAQAVEDDVGRRRRSSIDASAWLK
jgi:hypothetical protein